MAVLLVIHALLVLYSSRHNFLTVDEAGHLAAGVAHWETGRYFPYRVNPPLVRMLATLPVLAARPVTDYGHLRDVPGDRPEWELGQQFARDNATRYFDLLCLARLAGVGWSVLGGLLVFCWARELYRSEGGFLSLLLWCFSPNVLAFAQLIVPDLPATVAALAATYAFWHYLRQPSWERALLAGLLLGVAQLTKFTLLVLYGAWPLLVLLWLAAPGGAALRSAGCRKLAGHALIVLLVSLYVINVGYSFTGTCKRLGDYPFVSRLFAGAPQASLGHEAGAYGNRFHDTWMKDLLVPLPEDFLRGIDLQRVDFEKGFPSYLAGEWHLRGEGGWWYYYLYALAVKVPLGALILVLASVVVTLGGAFRASWSNEAVLALPAVAVLLLVSSQTGFNHHMRYVLPLFPFVIVSTGKLTSYVERDCWPVGLGVAAMLSWAIVSCLAVYPHTLSYFNELAGGPEHGDAHLVDSNIDWGQDLLELKDWLDRHPECRPLHLAYFGRADPRLLSIDFTLPALGPGAYPSPESKARSHPGPRPGWYAVSVNFLRGMEFSAPDGRGGFRQTPLHAFTYFQAFKPVARAGYSIRIYHISPEEAKTVRRQLGFEEPLAERP